MTADLVHRLRTACSPESPLGKLFTEAAVALEKAQRVEDASESTYKHWRERAQEAEASLKAVTAERDDNWKLAEDERHSANHWHAEWEAAEASLKEAVQLLKPFAEMCDDVLWASDDPDDFDWIRWDGLSLSVGNIRAARRFVDNANGGDDDNHG